MLSNIPAERSALRNLREALDFAQRLARELPPQHEQSRAELIEALGAAQFCAQRLAAECTAKKRPQRQR